MNTHPHILDICVLFPLRMPKVLYVTRALFQYKDCLSWYRNSHYKDKMVVRSSFLYTCIGNPYTDKMESWYWDSTQGNFSSKHWGMIDMADILQTTFSNSFSQKRKILFWLKFHHEGELWGIHCESNFDQKSDPWLSVIKICFIQ